jgi:hypothetical protein
LYQLACEFFYGWHATLLSLEGRDKKLSINGDFFDKGSQVDELPVEEDNNVEVMD